MTLKILFVLYLITIIGYGIDSIRSLHSPSNRDALDDEAKKLLSLSDMPGGQLPQHLLTLRILMLHMDICDLKIKMSFAIMIQIIVASVVFYDAGI